MFDDASDFALVVSFPLLDTTTTTLLLLLPLA
jgi:hypothetical protein